MSLLADLLSKVKQPSPKKDIPPNLKNIVSDSARKSALKRKILFLSVVFIVAVASGFLIVYFMQSFNQRTLSRGHRAEGIEQKSQNTEHRPQTIDNKVKAQKNKSAEVRAGLALPLRSGRTEERKGKGETNSRKQREDGRNQGPAVSNQQPAAGSQQIPTDNRQPITDIRADVDAHLYSARQYEIKKDYSKAMHEYNKVIEIDKNNFGAMNKMAYLLLHLGQAEGSIKYSQMALDINKDYVPALVNFAVAHAKLGNISTAESYLKRALLIEASNTSVLSNLALLYERKGDYSRAYEYFSRLAASGDITGYLGLARIYEKQNKIEDALKVYKNIYALSSVENETRQMVKERIVLLTQIVPLKK